MSEATLALSEVLEFVVDNRGKNPPLSDVGYPVIEGNAIVETDRFPQYDKVRKFVSQITYEKWFRKGHPKFNDVLFVTVGGIGSVALMDSTEACIAQNIVALRFREDYDPRFYYYYFKQKQMQQFFKSLDISSVQPSIKVPHLLETQIPILDLHKQQAIAGVLTSLDDKLDLLHRQNKTLEALASTLFRQWFIEEAEGGWKEIRLGDLAEFKRGISYSGDLLGEDGDGTPMHNLNSIDINGAYKYDGIKFYTGKVKPAQTLKPGDLLIVNTDITQDNRIIGWPLFVPERFEVSTFTHHLYSVTLLTGTVSKIYLYFLLRWRDYRDQLASSANGTTVSMLSKESIGNLTIKVPPEAKRKRFENVAGEILAKQTLNQEQVRTVMRLRDELLPKLMSGRVRVEL